MTEEIHALSGAYAIDALDASERSRFERHLTGCSACRDEVESLRVAAAELSGLTEVAAPASLRASVLSGITAVRPLPPLPRPDAATVTDLAESSRTAGTTSTLEPGEKLDSTDAADSPVVPHGPVADSDVDSASSDGPDARVTSITDAPRCSGRSSTRTPWRGLLAAAAAAVLVLGGFTIFRSVQGNDAPPTVAQKVLDAPDAVRSEHTFANGGTASIVRSASLGKAVLVGKNLPPPGADKTYQLWLQSKTSTFASAGLVPGSGDQVVVLEGDAATAAGAGITIEPAGGSKQPTTEPLALFPFSA